MQRRILTAYEIDYNFNQLSGEECGKFITAFMREFPSWGAFIQQRVANSDRGNHILYIIRNDSCLSVDNEKGPLDDEEAKIRGFVKGFIRAVELVKPDPARGTRGYGR